MICPSSLCTFLEQEALPLVAQAIAAIPASYAELVVTAEEKSFPSDFETEQIRLEQAMKQLAGEAKVFFLAKPDGTGVGLRVVLYLLPISWPEQLPILQIADGTRIALTGDGSRLEAILRG